MDGRRLKVRANSSVSSYVRQLTKIFQSAANVARVNGRRVYVKGPTPDRKDDFSTGDARCLALRVTVIARMFVSSRTGRASMSRVQQTWTPSCSDAMTECHLS